MRPVSIDISGVTFPSISRFADYYAGGDPKKRKQIQNRINDGWTPKEAIGVDQRVKRVGRRSKGVPNYTNRVEWEERACRDCGELKNKKDFPIQRTRVDGTPQHATLCKKCVNARRKESGVWHEYYLKNKRRHHLLTKKYYENSKNTLADSYIKRLLTKHSNVPAKDLPSKLIEVKRLQLMIDELLEDI